MGDFNIDLLDVNNNNLEAYVETMFDYNFYPLINKPSLLLITFGQMLLEL